MLKTNQIYKQIDEFRANIKKEIQNIVDDISEKKYVKYDRVTKGF